MNTWNTLRFPGREDRIWELYHENSKASRFVNRKPSRDTFQEAQDVLHRSLPVQSAWETPLHFEENSVLDAITRALENADSVPPTSLTLKSLSAILRFCNGTRVHDSTWIPGTMPLEIFGVSSGMDGLPNCLFHFDTELQRIQCLHEHVDRTALSGCFPERTDTGTYLFITGIFQRSALHFGERGYRLALTESGRWAQSMLFASAALGVKATLESEYYDRHIEAILGIDGVEHAVLQVISF